MWTESGLLCTKITLDSKFFVTFHLSYYFNWKVIATQFSIQILLQAITFLFHSPQTFGQEKLPEIRGEKEFGKRFTLKTEFFYTERLQKHISKAEKQNR